MARSMSALSSASRGSVIRQRTVAELRRKAPRLHTMIYSLGFPQNKRLVTELKGQDITAAYDGM